MPRRPRVTLAGVPLHLIQRGNNRQACFFAEEDYRAYLGWLEEYARASACAIHAYVLMTNHVHLLLTPRASGGASELMKRLGQRYVQYVNRTTGRSGTLWEGRFRSCLTQEEGYVLSCYRYIELNPVRANMVRHPGEYPWSSYRANAQGELSTLLTPHRLYTALGNNAEARQAAYRELFRYQLDPGTVDEIRAATNGNFALGSSQFQAQVTAALGRRVTRGKSGRPQKQSESKSSGLFDGG
ncbi:transposase [Nitrococcus mobilis]|uniref:Predicted transposase n=1 Tax=Nitrococcus mobilis Nb-231 TaxID=314278 RepID=A4BR58_9GAMM|nr:transposase [Nitrococcus mobilis]EAR21680.1 predicted transposase [Nitrococcus mobilis Nb-231]